MDNNGKYKSLLKDTFIFALGSFGSKLISFFLVPLYTNFLTKAEYGTADLVSTFSQLIIPFVTVVINEAVIRYGMKKGAKKENVALCAFVILGCSVIITLAITPIIGLYGPIKEWKWYLCAQIVFSGFREVEFAYLKVKNKNRLYALCSIVQTAILATTNVIVITICHFGIRGYLISNAIAPGCAAFIAFFLSGLHKDLKHAEFDARLFKQMVVYSSPLILNNVSWWVVHSSDKIMIEAMLNASVLGVYTAATKIPSLINVITGFFTQAWGLSSIREVESSNDGAFYNSVFSFYSTVTIGACIFITAAIKTFMSFYVGSDFREAWMFTPLLLSAAVFNSISSYYGSLYAAANRTVNNMWSTIICALTNVVLNYILIKRIGAWGAVIGTVASYFVVAHIRMIFIKKYMPVSFNVWKYISSVILMIIQCLLVTLDWHGYIVSGIVAIIFLWINWSVISQIPKTIASKNKTNAESSSD